MKFIKKQINLALLVSGAIILHILEFMLPTTMIFPGAKLGLANIITLFVILKYGFISGLQVSLLRIIISSVLAGTFLTTSFFLSLTGGLLSLLVMSLFYYYSSKFSIIGISILGAASHNFAQVLMAATLIDNWRLLFYLPYLLILSLPTGIFVALLIIKLEKYLKFDLLNKKEFETN
ncbi:Gx transporter family protein [Orenia marismortui]|uniref:Gx transporter family protein n=1 Tax=Orenia marismortui TaxID=46469 RepID=UPI000371E337|nr:Gx transporter family protein [Orenia marismortui]